MEKIDEIIKNTNDKNVEKINWTKVWSKKYPVLETYRNNVDTLKYSKEIRKMLEELKEKYGYNEMDAMLVLKDILYHEWKDNQKG